MSDPTSGSLPPSYFEGLYAADPDPWRFATSDYERDKYRATLAALPRERYASAFEVGCSIGVLTRQLTARCDRLLAVDAAANALDDARRRCADLAADLAADPAPVRFDRMVVPGDWPAETFDLILLSEVVYYLDRADVGRLVERVRAALRPGGDVLLVHWTGLTNYPLSGDEAAETFLTQAAGFTTVLVQQRAEQYRLDLIGRR